MSYIDEFMPYHLNPKYGEIIKEELIQRLKDDALFVEKITEVDALSNFDVVTSKNKLLVVIDRIPLISLEVDANSDTFDTTCEIRRAYNERFGKVND